MHHPSLLQTLTSERARDDARETAGARAEKTSMTTSPPSAPWVAALETTCAPLQYLCYADVTDGHAVEGAKDGRALRADGRDVQLLIVSSRFAGLSSVARQELVNDVLGEHLRSGVLHSVQMRCWDPEQWAARGTPVDLGRPCTASWAANADEQPLGPSMALDACTAPPRVDDGASPASAAAEDAPPPPAASPTAAAPTDALVAHLREQGPTEGLATALAILTCEHASDSSREAARLFLASVEEQKEGVSEMW